MRIYLTRHGETIENIEGRLMGHLHGHLSNLGIQQAKRLSKRLEGEHFDYAYSSDLNRAIATTEKILIYHISTPIEFRGDLRERFMGSYEGRLKKNCSEIKDITPRNFESPDGESLISMYARAGNFSRMIMTKHPVGNVILVGHNGINRGIIGNLLGKPFEAYTSIPVQENCSLSIFEINGSNVESILLNCTKHLN